MNKPRLLIILNRLATGGPALNTLCMAAALSETFEVLVIAGEPNVDEQPADYLLDQYKGFRFQKITTLRRSVLPAVDWKAYRTLKKIITAFKPDIVHTHGTKPGVLGRIAAHHCNVPVIVHTYHGHVFHSYFSKIVSGCIVQAERWLSRYSTALIAISDVLRNELVHSYRIAPATKVKLVRLGIDTAAFQDNDGNKRQQFRNEFHLAAETKVIGIAGRLVPIKQHRLFIDTAVALLKQQDRLPKLQFFLIGDGFEKKTIQQYIAQKGYTWQSDAVADEVTAPFVFTSWRTDMDVVFAGLDLVMLTSLNEGTPVSIMEAMAAGKPVVSTNVGGIAELVKAGETGFLNNTAEELAASVRLLLEKPLLAAQMAEAAARTAGARFSQTTEFVELSALYEALLLTQESY